MNTRIRNYFVLVIFSLLSMPMLAQQNNRQYYNYQRDWTFGIHAGASWQDSDVFDRFGGGLGLTLGKRVYGHPGSFWAVDLRGRMTYSNSFGQDHLRNTDLDANSLIGQVRDNSDNGYASLGYAYNNYRTDMLDLDVEGVLTLNRLRERTGIVAQLFGGLGVDFYESKIDQLDVGGNLHQYQVIDDSTQSNLSIRRDIDGIRGESFRNGDYETTNGTKLTFMPSWGVGIGYQPREWFSFGYEHRFAYPFTDELDGIEGVNVGQDWINDVHHLSYLYARFHFGVNGSCSDPIINVTAPRANPYTTQAPSVNLEAEITNVSNSRDITVTVNNLPVYSHTYNSATDVFRLPVLLVPGENTVRIVAKNGCGEDVAVVRIIYNELPNAGIPPIVTFTNPSNRSYTTSESNFDLRAEVTRVSRKTDVRMTVNGASTRNFQYSNGQVQANLNLREGENIVEISGRNQYGEDTKSVVIVRQEDQPSINPPSVRITRPSTDPYNTSNQTVRVEADIDNVRSKSDVTFRVNGQDRNFSYNTSSGRLESNVTLREGQNRVVVSASNRAGQDSDDATIYYQRNVIDPPAQNPPVVNITSPSRKPYTTTNDRYEIRATVRNVDNKSQIEFRMNGRTYTNFSYNANSDQFRLNVNLEEGANVFEISARNSAGQDADDGNIVYKRDQQFKPVVDITSPASGDIVYNSTQQINATVKNVSNKNQITFYINGNTSNDFAYNATTEKFVGTARLQQGQNTIRIKAVNRAGEDDDNIILNFRNAGNPPVITINRPNSNPHTQSTNDGNVQATITNVTSKSQVTFKVNGRNAAFNFNPSSKRLTANFTLNEGTNRFEITAQNSHGSDNDGGVINFMKPIQRPPTVNITSPNNGKIVYKSKERIKARLTNITQKSQITFKVNGVSTRDFSFNVKDQFEADANLKQGQNTIEITATNASGKASDNVIINFRNATQPPVITNVRPTQNPHNVSTDRTRITATIKNVTTRSGVKFELNGRNVTNFTYNSSGNFGVNIVLKEGQNRFLITATNSAGQDQYKGEIIYKKAILQQPPQVVINSPNNGKVVYNNKETISATIKNIQSKNQVTFLVNGKRSNDFSFNSRTQRFTGNASLQSGNNNISVEAKNSAGTDKDQVTVNYRQASGCDKPRIVMVSPTRNPFTITDNRTGAKADVFDVQGASNITVTVNGANIRNNWSYNVNTKRLNVDYTNWRVGSNNLVIKATNSCGTTTKSQTIIYKQVLPPKVTFTKPNKNVSTTKSRMDIQATVTNSTKRDINLTVNGKRATYNLSGTRLTARVNLGVGVNTIVLKSSNAGGNDSKTLKITYSKPVLKPTISFSSPRGAASVNKNKYTVRATLKHIDSKGQINVTLNGSSVSGYSFNARSGALAFNATLKEGNNTIVIGVRNSAGADMKTATVRYTKPSQPSNRNNGKNEGNSNVNRGNNNGGSDIIRSRGASKPKVVKQPSKPKKPKTSKPKKPKTKTKKQPSKPKVNKPKTKKPSKPKTSKPKKTAPKKPAPKKPKKEKDNDRKKREGN